MIKALREAQQSALKAAQRTLIEQQNGYHEVNKYMSQTADAVTEMHEVEDQAQGLVRQAVEIAQNEHLTAQLLREETILQRTHMLTTSSNRYSTPSLCPIYDF